MANVASQSANLFNSIGAIGGIVQGVGGVLQGRQETALGDYNAKILEERAVAERQSFALLEEQKKRITKSQIGSQVALYAGSGIKMSGSPTAVILDSETNANLDLAIERYNSDVRARGFENQAAVTRYEASQKSARSYAGAAKTFLTTAADSYTSQIGKTGQKLGAGKTSYGIKVPSRYIPPK